MAKLDDIISYLNELFPPETALGFDNSGLMVLPQEDMDVNNVLLSLDMTSSSLKRATDISADLIITHHPMIFGGIKSVNYSDPCGRFIVELIRNNIACFSCHTNMDANDDFSNKILANCAIADNLSAVNDSEDVFCGVIAELKNPESLRDFVVKVRENLKASGASTINNPNNPVSTVYVQGGSFDEDAMPFLIKSEVDTVLTGEIKHHLSLLLDEYGISSVAIGHNASERVFMNNLSAHLQEKFPEINFFVDLGNEKNVF